MKQSNFTETTPDDFNPPQPQDPPPPIITIPNRHNLLTDSNQIWCRPTDNTVQLWTSMLSKGPNQPHRPKYHFKQYRARFKL